VTDSVAEFCFEAAGTDVTLRTTLNEFLLLSNTQFVENRVYDDDEGGEEAPAAAPTSASRARRAGPRTRARARSAACVGASAARSVARAGGAIRVSYACL
jgi:hypothetical protein